MNKQAIIERASEKMIAYQFRISERELRKIERVAERYNVSASKLVRAILCEFLASEQVGENE